MFKRILSIFLVVAVFVVSGMMVGCSKTPENYALDGVSSNGGIGAISGEYLYYIGGGTTTLNGASEEVITSTSIYKQKVDANGNPVQGEEPVIVYRGIAGFQKGQLYIFGDHIYFAVPSSKMSSSADKLVNRTSFVRIKLDGTGYEELYTTETEGNLSYEYYLASEDDAKQLYIVVLDGTDLYTLKVGKKTKRKDIDSDVTSAMFTSTNGLGGGAEEYVFYTKAPSETYLTQKGSMIYKADPAGKNTKLISSGEDIKLLKVQHGHLYFSCNNKMYRSTTVAGLDKTNVVSYTVFKSYIFLANGGVIGVDENESSVVYVRWEAGVLKESKKLLSSKDYTLMMVDGDNLFVHNSSKIVYRINYTAASVSSSKVYGTKITTVGGALTYEKIGKFIYTFEEKTIKDSNGNDLKLTSLVKLDSTNTIKES